MKTSSEFYADFNQAGILQISVQTVRRRLGILVWENLKLWVKN